MKNVLRFAPNTIVVPIQIIDVRSFDSNRACHVFGAISTASCAINIQRK